MKFLTPISTSAFAVYGADAPDTPRNRKLQEADVKPLIQLMVRASKHPSLEVSGHAFECLSVMPIVKGSEILKDKDAVHCIVGHLRSRELTTRVDAFRAMNM